jgi:hypothetical protein
MAAPIGWDLGGVEGPTGAAGGVATRVTQTDGGSLGDGAGGSGGGHGVGAVATAAAVAARQAMARRVGAGRQKVRLAAAGKDGGGIIGGVSIRGSFDQQRQTWRRPGWWQHQHLYDAAANRAKGRRKGGRELGSDQEYLKL